MPNHYHFLIRQNGNIPAGELATRVFGGYSRAVNRRYGWSGTLFEGRFQAALADTEPYLRHLCCYIHANPVKDGIVKQLEDWQYSNYLEWVGVRQGTLVDREFIQVFFGDASSYQAYVLDYLRMRQLLETLMYLVEW